MVNLKPISFKVSLIQCGEIALVKCRTHLVNLKKSFCKNTPAVPFLQSNFPPLFHQVINGHGAVFRDNISANRLDDVMNYNSNMSVVFL